MLTSKILVFILICSIITYVSTKKNEDFAEFDEFDTEEFDDDIPVTTATTSQSSKSQSNKPEHFQKFDDSQSKSSEIREDEVIIDDDDDDEAMFDEEEFEASDSFESSHSSTPNLTITEVPVNLTGNGWEAYYCECIMIILLLGYLINFFIGRTKNSQLTTAIFNAQYDLLHKIFLQVGDSGQEKSSETNEQKTIMQKESENLYVLWCSGRATVDSMLMELHFIKRQCLFNSLASFIKSVNDTIVYTIDYSKDDMDTAVFCLARKRCAAKLHREMIDLNYFFAERKVADKKRFNGNYHVLSEFSEISNYIIDQKLSEFIEKFPDAIEYIHVSDQYMGRKNQTNDTQSSSNNSTNSGTATQQQDAINASERSVRRVLIVAFNLLSQNDRSLQVTCEISCNDYLCIVLHLMDRISTLRIQTKDFKNKALKNRQRIDEQFLKTVNQQRQELAQQRREEQRRAEKEKVMQSDDPEVQRKWEEKEHKREIKRRQPKTKQMKIKSA